MTMPHPDESSARPLIAHRYRPVERIGGGAMGVVWRGVDERLDRVVALKQVLLAPGDPDDEDVARIRERALREGRIAGRLSHPDSVGVLDAVEQDGLPWLVMEYVPAPDLRAVLDERGPLSPVATARVGAGVAAALDEAHRAGVVHRDVTPSNVLVRPDGTGMLTDYGVAVATWDEPVAVTGCAAGTPAYFSPEAARGHEPAPASDVFSLGATLYRAVEGRPPFGPADNQLAVIHRAAECDVDPHRRAGVLGPVLDRMLDPDAGRRPTMGEVANALAALVEGRPIEPLTVGEPVGVPPWRPGALAALSTLGAAVAAGGAVASGVAGTAGVVAPTAAATAVGTTSTVGVTASTGTGIASGVAKVAAVAWWQQPVVAAVCAGAVVTGGAAGGVAVHQGVWAPPPVAEQPVAPGESSAPPDQSSSVPPGSSSSGVPSSTPGSASDTPSSSGSPASTTSRTSVTGTVEVTVTR